MSAADQQGDAEVPGEAAPPPRIVPPSEGRRALVATLLGAAMGLLAALFSRRDDPDER